MTDFAEFHDELRATARDVLAGEVGWAQVTRAGWPGLEVPEKFDGAGAGFAEVAVVLRELGRAAARGPYPAVALSVAALNLVEPEPVRDELLRETGAGRVIPILVLDGDFRVEGARLSGSAEFVLDAPSAGCFLLPAPEGLVVADALSVTEQPVVDGTRSFGRVVADEAAVSSVLRFAVPEPLQLLRDRAAVAVACDSLGLSEAMLEATVAYAGIREQFGRKIGSFQAVKHACADMYVQLRVAGKLVEAAVGGGSVEAAMAKSYVCAAAVDIVGKAMQLHGGIGYTWESGVHAFLKRATLNRSLFGSPAMHRRRLSERYRGVWPPAPAGRLS
ncbi:acyl-CoA dehydrogenase [Amycolatopsis acidicola]|uniref:Acyl-CoA dehydrogenase n=1 Tax=Amycolatopsis acidicola TaxID=2596893 RepID=A0A5N0V057_9PSEU|nr:acyl-CoA dehydrogenase family protein [Amycolatopsis acidicola]KAA9159791.1 acyl-CoA dehydrogenase [Amycolatopsis acidicola]